MADAHTLLEQYISAHRGGEEADPAAWLDRLPDGGERAKLAALIDAYLSRAPMREWDPDAFRASGLAPFAERANLALYSEAGSWPAVLPQLREKARIKRSDLVARLASALGAQDKQAKVNGYYHEMETGLLPSDGVDDRVLDALGSILGQSADALRSAGRAVGGAAPGPAPGVAFARTASEAQAGAEPAASAPPPEGEWDEVDRLFRGG